MRSRIEFFTPKEILEKYPRIIEVYYWDESDLGCFLKAGILKGYYCRTKRLAMITESSVLNLIRFLNDSKDKDHIDFNDL